jgi:hypothetical protein
MFVKATETNDGRTNSRGSAMARVGPARTRSRRARARVGPARALVAAAARLTARVGRASGRPTPTCDAAQTEAVRVVLGEDDPEREDGGSEPAHAGDDPGPAEGQR